MSIKQLPPILISLIVFCACDRDAQSSKGNKGEEKDISLTKERDASGGRNPDDLGSLINEVKNKGTDRDWVLSNLDEILKDSILVWKIQERGADKILYAVNTVTPYTGWVKETFVNGQVARLMNVIQGKTMLAAEWYESGQSKSWKLFHPTSGSSHGLHSYWYENGNLKSQWNYREGRLHGVAKGWDETGIKSKELHYKEGKQNGLYMEWYSTGQKKLETNYENGVKHGKEIEWYENGQISVEGSYMEGKLHGRWEIWYPNGKKRFVQNRHNNLVEGLNEGWHSNGQKAYTQKYSKGMLVGNSMSWDEDGKLIQEWVPKPRNGAFRKERQVDQATRNKQLGIPD